eukprot:3955113-Lingulodinium_polyedra.AAC.1
MQSHRGDLQDLQEARVEQRAAQGEVERSLESAESTRVAAEGRLGRVQDMVEDTVAAQLRK